MGEILLAKGLHDAGGHGVIEVRNGLAAVHFVLVGLNGDAAQGRVGADVVGFPQAAVSGGKAALEELQKIDLAAGLGEHVEIHVVDMNVAVYMGGGDVLGQDAVNDEILRAFRAVFQHGAHGGVGVDVGVFPFEIRFPGILVGQFVVDVHEVHFRLADAGVGCPVENVGLGRAGVVILDENPLHRVLNVLDPRCFLIANVTDDALGQRV